MYQEDISRKFLSGTRELNKKKGVENVDGSFCVCTECVYDGSTCECMMDMCVYFVYVCLCIKVGKNIVHLESNYFFYTKAI